MCVKLVLEFLNVIFFLTEASVKMIFSCRFRTVSRPTLFGSVFILLLLAYKSPKTYKYPKIDMFLTYVKTVWHLNFIKKLSIIKWPDRQMPRHITTGTIKMTAVSHFLTYMWFSIKNIIISGRIDRFPPCNQTCTAPPAPCRQIKPQSLRRWRRSFLGWWWRIEWGSCHRYRYVLLHSPL